MNIFKEVHEAFLNHITKISNERERNITECKRLLDEIDMGYKILDCLIFVSDFNGKAALKCVREMYDLSKKEN